MTRHECGYTPKQAESAVIVICCALLGLMVVLGCALYKAGHATGYNEAGQQAARVISAGRVVDGE